MLDKYNGRIIGRCLYFGERYKTLDEDKLDDVCCKEMEFHILEHEQPILYDDRLREYSLKCILNGAGAGVIQNIKYCPFCGKKLPKPLRTKWYNTLEKLGIDDPNEDEEKMPEEFKDATWWKNRGL